ncbi:MAG: DUF3095 domain-containing protein [Tibeticola sp.]
MAEPLAQALLTELNAVPELPALRDWWRSQAFAEVPGHWQVFVTDVVDSTAALARGQYKQVNALGAACLIAAANATGRDDLPGVFTGDGAVLVVPPSCASAVGDALRGVQALGERQLGLTLRLGMVEVAALNQRGASVRLARRRWSAGFGQALFSGGGVQLAERLIREDPARWAVPRSVGSGRARLEGLECRWNDVPATRGRMVSLIVRPRGRDLSALAPLLAWLEALPQAAPVRVDNLPLQWPPQHLGVEMRLKHLAAPARGLHTMAARAWTGLLAPLVRRDGRNPSTAAGRYVAALAANTDHLKLDDVLRAVLDLTGEEVATLEAVLADPQRQGLLDYGLHRSDHALMTCFIRSRTQHLHFVDGGGGGLTQAARLLKP